MTKQEFFELYNKVIYQEINLYSLDKPTLLKIEAMLKEEIKIKDKILRDLNKKLSELRNSTASSTQ